MKVAMVVLCLALVAVTSGQRFSNRRFRPIGGATGFANSGSVQGQSSNFGGISQLQQSGANAAVSTTNVFYIKGWLYRVRFYLNINIFRMRFACV